MSNREKTQGEAPASSRRREPPRVAIHDKDGGADNGAAEQDVPRASAAPPPRTPARSNGSVPELRMPSRDLTAPKTVVIYDAQNRKLTVRQLNAMDRLNMYEAAGPKLSANQGWMGVVAVAMSCVEIDGEPIQKPLSAMEMKAVVARVDQDGLDAIQHVYNEIWGVGVEDDETADEATARKGKN